jgi:hypothetical protein
MTYFSPLNPPLYVDARLRLIEAGPPRVRLGRRVVRALASILLGRTAAPPPRYFTLGPPPVAPVSPWVRLRRRVGRWIAGDPEPEPTAWRTAAPSLDDDEIDGEFDDEDEVPWS